MKKNPIFYNPILTIFLLIVLFVTSDFANSGDSIALKNKIASRIDLLNKIIKNPDEACMKNWVLLSNPHDEIEFRFYKNSISDGSKSAYDKRSETWEKILKHSRSKSTDEPSVVLQYLRLSLMAYSVRSGDEPAVFKFNFLNYTNSNEVVAKVDFKVNNSSGRRISKEAKIVFEVSDSPQNDLYLQKIYIVDRLVYGWWYKSD